MSKLFILIVAWMSSIFNLNMEKASEVCLRCNILMIDVDILRADELPCYGYPKNTAPNICKLAEKSTIFNDNYSTSYWTLPSIMSTVTSLYPTFHRVTSSYGSQNYLDANKETLAKSLQKSGYRTIFVGNDSDPAILSLKNGGLQGYSEIISNKPIEDVVAELKNSDRPWFLHYYQSKLHMPYLINEDEEPMDSNLPRTKLPLTNKEFDTALGKYVRQNYKKIFRTETISDKNINLKSYLISDDKMTELFYKLRYSGKQEEYLLDGWKPIYDTYLNSIDIKNPIDVDYMRMMYDTKLVQSDNEIGNVLDLMKDELKDNLIVTITSDHGEAFGERGYFSHESDFYSGLYWTPLIIYSPKIKPRQINQSTSNIDIYPTLLQMSGIEIPPGLQGRSWFYPEKNTGKNTFMLNEFSQGHILQNKNWLYFLPSWVEKPGDGQLYLKQSDPKQQHNIVDKYPELAKELYGQIKIIRSYNELLSNQPIKTNFDQIKISPEKLERLKKEGYF